MKVAPPRRRATIQDGPDGLEVIFPAKRNVFLMLFLTFWLGGWALGEITVTKQLLFGQARDATAFLVFWLAGWTVGGAVAIHAWLWMLAGRERLVLRHDALLIQREIFGFRRTREYDLAHVANLRSAPTLADPWSQSMRVWGIGGGMVAFDYGARTFRFGDGIEEAEAAQVVTDLRARLGARAA